MSNLLFFGSGVAKGAGEFLDEKKAAYERQVEFTTRSLREELKAARLARRAKTDAATQRLEELGSLGITGAAAESMLRLSDPLYQTHITKFMEMGAAPEGLSIREQQERLGFRFDPSMADQKPSTNEEILNRYIGEFPAAAIRPKDEPDFRSGIARAFGFADPEDQAMEQAAKSLGISTDQAAALLDDTFEREAYNRGVTLTPVKTDMQRRQEQTIDNQAELVQMELEQARKTAAYADRKLTEDLKVPTMVYGDDGVARLEYTTIPKDTIQSEVDARLKEIKDMTDLQTAVLANYRSLQPEGAKLLGPTEFNIFANRLGKKLVHSGIFGESYTIGETGQVVPKTDQLLIRQIFENTEGAMITAGQNILNNPGAHGLEGRDLVGAGALVAKEQLTIAGQEALEIFNQEVDPSVVAALVAAGTLQNIFDPLAGRNDAIILPKALQDYIIKSYTEEGFYKSEREKYEFLLGQRISVTSARTMEAPLPTGGADQPATDLQKAQQSLSGMVARLEGTDADKFFGSPDQATRKREVEFAVSSPESAFYIADEALQAQFIELLEGLPNVNPATLRAAITNITALEALPPPPEPAEAQVDPPKPQKIAPPTMDTPAGEVVARGQAAVKEGAKAFIAGVSRSPDLQRNQPTDLETLYNAAETQMKDRLSVVSTFGTVPARTSRVEGRVIDIPGKPGTRQTLYDFLKEQENPDIAIDFIKRMIVDRGGRQAELRPQLITQDARTRLAKMLYQQYINSDYEIASPSQEGLAAVGMSTGGLMLPPAN